MTLFTIATGKYLDYFKLQIDQLSQFLAPGHPIQIIVATNREDKPPIVLDKRIVIQYVAIEDMPWPDITLHRYAVILKSKSLITGNTLMWLDTDMALKKIVRFKTLSNGHVAPARHPGFVFGASNFLKLPYSQKIDVAKSYLSAWRRWQPALGAWENSKASNAYVHPMLRKNYVHGAIWAGPTEKVLEMCELLVERIAGDSDKKIVATWHDESHLNWFASHHKVKLLPKYFSSWDGAWQYKVDKATFLSLDKKVLDDHLTSSSETKLT